MAEAEVDDRISVTRTLWELKKRNHITARPIPKERRAKSTGRGSIERLEYAVAPECVLPYGLTAGEVCMALIGRNSQ